MSTQNTYTDKLQSFRTGTGSIRVQQRGHGCIESDHLSGEYDARVTTHAEERYLQRVDETEAFPASRVMTEFLESVDIEIEDDSITDPTRRHPESGVVYVYDPDDWTVITCFEPKSEQLAGVEVSK